MPWRVKMHLGSCSMTPDWAAVPGLRKRGVGNGPCGPKSLERTAGRGLLCLQGSASRVNNSATARAIRMKFGLIQLIFMSMLKLLGRHHANLHPIVNLQRVSWHTSGQRSMAIKKPFDSLELVGRVDTSARTQSVCLCFSYLSNMAVLSERSRRLQ